MTFYGKIHNGVVVLDGPTDLPEGTPVTVLIDADRPVANPYPDRLTPEELRRRKSILDAISALPIEGPSEPFSGKDHDKVLYGEP
jgi:hypothetical protein